MAHLILINDTIKVYLENKYIYLIVEKEVGDDIHLPACS